MIGLSHEGLDNYKKGRLKLDIEPPDFWWFCPTCKEFHPGYNDKLIMCDKEEERNG
jgi:hypothetical protein